MDVAMSRLIETLILPPGGPLFMVILGLLIISRLPRLGHTLALVGTVVLFIASLPVVSYALLHSLEKYPALEAKALGKTNAQAIIVLGSGRYIAPPEYGYRDTVSRWGIERLRYAAYLHRLTGLPVLVSGGSPTSGRIPEAQFTRTYLQRELGVTHVWTEESSGTTAENATNSANLLRKQRVKRAFLVTHAWHQPRAVDSFNRAGFEVIPAPTAFAQRASAYPWLPSAEALAQTRAALHEWVGIGVYALVE